MNSNYDNIRAKIRQIPHGKVSTYGQIAEMVGLPRHARLVGYTLRNTPDHIDIPWHRVINAKGESSFPADSAQYILQKKLLIKEGVVIIGGKISLQQFGWKVTLDELLWKL